MQFINGDLNLRTLTEKKCELNKIINIFQWFVKKYVILVIRTGLFGLKLHGSWASRMYICGRLAEKTPFIF